MGLSQESPDNYTIPFLIICIVRVRVELAVKVALEDQNSCKHFETFIEEIYSLYNQLPKNWRELDNIVSELGVEIIKFGNIFDIGWVVSSVKTVSAVCKC